MGGGSSYYQPKQVKSIEIQVTPEKLQARDDDDEEDKRGVGLGAAGGVGTDKHHNNDNKKRRRRRKQQDAAGGSGPHSTMKMEYYPPGWIGGAYMSGGYYPRYSHSH